MSCIKTLTTRSIAMLGLLVGMAGCVSTPVSPDRTAPIEHVRTLDGASPDGQDLDYLVVEPHGEVEDGPAPLLIFLHGRGESQGPLSRVSIHGPIKYGRMQDDFPFLIVAPHLPANIEWTPDAVMAVLDAVKTEWPIDESRIYLTGLSLGGHGTFDTAVAHPAAFAAIAPVAGRGDPAGACALRDLPVWSFHGVDDTVVLARDNQAMVDAVRACGGAPGLTLYPDLGHNAWDPAYADAALYNWLLTHAR